MGLKNGFNESHTLNYFIFLKIIHALWPPNPKVLDIAKLTSLFWAFPNVKFKLGLILSSKFLWFIVGGIILLFIERIDAIASIAPAAPKDGQSLIWLNLNSI